jgi:hypothetical protein
MMRAYGSKKASRPYERIHTVHGVHACGECCGFNRVKTKARRSVEKNRAGALLRESACDG